MKNQIKNYVNQLLENLKKKKVCLSFIDNTWGADLVDMQLFSKFNKEIRFLLCVIYIYSNYAQAISLKDKKCLKTTNSFRKPLDESGRKPNIIWVDKGSEFYSRSIKS